MNRNKTEVSSSLFINNYLYKFLKKNEIKINIIIYHQLFI